jgi:hypothetical protein
MSVGFKESQKIELTSKLAKQGEAHANRADLSRENLRDVEVHGSIAASTGLMLAYSSSMLRLSMNSPLEGQVQIYKQNTESVSNKVGGTGVLSGHGGKA